MKEKQIVTVNALNTSDFSIQDGTISINATNIQGSGSSEETTFNSSQFNVTISEGTKEVSIKDEIGIFNQPKVLFNSTSFEANEYQFVDGEWRITEATDLIFKKGETHVDKDFHAIIVEGKGNSERKEYDSRYFDEDDYYIIPTEKLTNPYVFGDEFTVDTLRHELDSNMPDKNVTLNPKYKYKFDRYDFNASQKDDGVHISLKERQKMYFQDHFTIRPETNGEDVVFLSNNRSYEFSEDDFDMWFNEGTFTNHVSLKKSYYNTTVSNSDLTTFVHSRPKNCIDNINIESANQGLLLTSGEYNSGTISGSYITGLTTGNSSNLNLENNVTISGCLNNSTVTASGIASVSCSMENSTADIRNRSGTHIQGTNQTVTTTDRSISIVNGEHNIVENTRNDFSIINGGNNNVSSHEGSVHISGFFNTVQNPVGLNKIEIAGQYNSLNTESNSTFIYGNVNNVTATTARTHVLVTGNYNEIHYDSWEGDFDGYSKVIVEGTRNKYYRPEGIDSFTTFNTLHGFENNLTVNQDSENCTHSINGVHNNITSQGSEITCIVYGKNNEVTIGENQKTIIIGNGYTIDSSGIFINGIPKIETSGKHYSQGFITQSDERLKHVHKRITTKSNGLELYKFSYIETGNIEIGLLAQQARNLLQTKGYDEEVLNTVFTKIRGIDWKETLNNYNTEFNTNVETYPELKENFNTQKENKRVELGIKESSLNEFIKAINKIDKESRSKWQKNTYNTVKHFLDDTRWFTYVDDILCIDYTALNLLLD